MAWSTVGNIRGPQGLIGPDGIQGIRGEKGLEGDQGPRGLEGEQGIPGNDGIQGEDGAGIEIAGSVATYAALPKGLTAVDSGKGYLVQTDGKLYIWDGTKFPTNGQGVAFRGPQGEKGNQGEIGQTGGDGIQGIRGEKGLTGDKGSTGTTGARGSKWFSGNGVPSGVTGSVPGDMYLDTGTGAVYALA